MSEEQHLIPLTEKALEALEKRGINDEIAVRLGWKTCAGNPNWIAIPFKKNGKIVNHKYRTIIGEKRFSQDKGRDQCFYNHDVLLEYASLSYQEMANRPIVIVEGEMDCAIAMQCGFTAVSVPSGAPDREIEEEGSKKFEFLKDLPKAAPVIIATDTDHPGRILRKELAIRIGWSRCKIAKYPKGCKDLNEVFVNWKHAGVVKSLGEKATYLNEGGIFRMSDIPDMPEHTPFECGIESLSDMIKIRAGDLIVVSGIPSMGKTLFTNALVCNMARNYGWNVCFGSFEQNPRQDHLRYLRKFYLEKDSKQASAEELAEADLWIEKHFSFIVPDINTDSLVTLSWVLERVKAAVSQYGARIVIIDPWNELDHDRPHGMSLTEYTGYAIKEFKRVAKLYAITVIIVAHPAKMEKNKDGGFGVPTLYDISDSSHWANKCDLGIIVHRLKGEKEDDHAALIRVAKVRYWGIIGRVGDKYLEYLENRGTYLAYPDFVPSNPKRGDRAKTVSVSKKKPNDKLAKQKNFI